MENIQEDLSTTAETSFSSNATSSNDFEITYENFPSTSWLNCANTQNSWRMPPAVTQPINYHGMVPYYAYNRAMHIFYPYTSWQEIANALSIHSK